MGKTFLLLLLLILLAGCASGPVIQQQLPVHDDVVAQQQWLLHQNGKQFHLQALVQARPAALDVVVLDTLGQRLLTLHQQAGEATAEIARSHPVGRHWQEVLDALLLVLWPQTGMLDPDTGVRIQGNGRERGLYREAQPVASAICETADPWQGQCEVIWSGSSQSLEIESRRLK